MCEVLSGEELDTLDKTMTWVHFARGQTIFTEGDELENFYNVGQGIIRLVKPLPDGRRTILDFLFQGDFLGLTANGYSPYSAEAVTRVKLCCFPKENLRKMFQENPRMERCLLGMFTEKLVLTHSRIANLACKSAPERLASFLLGFEGNEDLRTKNGIINLPINRHDISDYLGLTIWTISRVLTRFRKDGLIEIDKRKTIYLKNKLKLQKLANAS